MFDINGGIKLFNQADFFAAHDFFEELWMEAKKEEKMFFQGMVQVSVGCYHFICGNLKGSQSQLIKSISKLNMYRPKYYNIDICKLISKIEKLSSTITEMDKLNNFKINPTILFRINLLTNV